MGAGRRQSLTTPPLCRRVRRLGHQTAVAAVGRWCCGRHTRAVTATQTRTGPRGSVGRGRRTHESGRRRRCRGMPTSNSATASPTPTPATTDGSSALVWEPPGSLLDARFRPARPATHRRARLGGSAREPTPGGRCASGSRHRPGAARKRGESPARLRRHRCRQPRTCARAPPSTWSPGRRRELELGDSEHLHAAVASAFHVRVAAIATQVLATYVQGRWIVETTRSADGLLAASRSPSPE